MALTTEQEQQAISLIRGFAMDAPLQAKSGHQGTAMSLAPLAHVLYSRVLKHDPADPEWPDRDRFVLSNGHASILQYSLLFLSGFGLTLDDIEAFRSWESRTPGHPEVHHTPGVEVTTGPLGQGFAIAMPTASPKPWPSGPVVTSTPGVCRASGCPGVRDSNWRNASMSASSRPYPVR